MHRPDAEAGGPPPFFKNYHPFNMALQPHAFLFPNGIKYYNRHIPVRVCLCCLSSVSKLHINYGDDMNPLFK